MPDPPRFTGPVGDDRRYRVDDLDLAMEGGEGFTYRAVETATGRPVALKMLTSIAPGDVGRLEARSAFFQRVRHPNLMRQLDVFVGTALRPATATPEEADFDVAYSVAEWVEGRTLAERADEWSATEMLGVVVQVGRALVALRRHRSEDAHAGLVHRDLKPANVRIRPDGTAVLVDFGVGRPVAPAMTTNIGTPGWRAPELRPHAPPPTTAVDVWGLGALAHWVLTGDPPLLDGAGPARERMVLATDRAGLARAKDVARHLSRALETLPADRPPDLSRWLDDLSAMVTADAPGGSAACRWCGAAVVTRSRFCEACGRRLGDPATEGAAWLAEVSVDLDWHAAQGGDTPCPELTERVIVPLGKPWVLIGRARPGDRVDVIDCLHDAAVSRLHAFLTRGDRCWWIEDLRSVNGTFVGPAAGPLPTDALARGARHRLRDDDRIYVGAGTRIVIRAADPR